MTSLVDKLRRVVKRLEEERGDFDFFGLFLRADSPDVWDVVVGAPWLSGPTPENLQLIAQELARDLSAEDFLTLSRIYVLERGGPLLYTTSNLPEVARGEYWNFVFNGVPITHGYVLAIDEVKDTGRRRGRMGRAR